MIKIGFIGLGNMGKGMSLICQKKTWKLLDMILIIMLTELKNENIQYC